MTSKTQNKSKVLEKLFKKIEKMHNDPKMIEKAEEFHRETSTLSERDLLKRFTI